MTFWGIMGKYVKVRKKASCVCCKGKTWMVIKRLPRQHFCVFTFFGNVAKNMPLIPYCTITKLPNCRGFFSKNMQTPQRWRQFEFKIQLAAVRHGRVSLAWVTFQRPFTPCSFSSVNGRVEASPLLLLMFSQQRHSRHCVPRGPERSLSKSPAECLWFRPVLETFSIH